jgi:hypothetical protein
MVAAAQSDPSLTDVSNYAMQLKPYFDAFPPEQIHVLTLESFRDDRDSALRAIFEWLGVDTSFQVPELGRLNASTDGTYQVRRGLNWLARTRKSPPWRRATQWLPEKFHHAAHKLAFRRISLHPSDRSEFIEYLRPILAERARELSELLGREFSQWKTTFPNGQPR